MKKTVSICLSLMLLLGLLAGCGGGAQPDAPDSASASQPGADAGTEPQQEHEAVTILVAAAASLEYSYVQQLIPMFEALYPWVSVEGTYDSSGKLQTQIEEGLAADVFMSAATKQMNALDEAGLILGASVVPLLENKIVLIAPAEADTDIASFEQMLEAGQIALGDPESVPAGQYARQALQNLGLWDAVEAKNPSYGTNVTEVLNWVAAGSADVGIVYATDAATTDAVRVLAAAPQGSLNDKIIYPVGILAASAHPEEAALFVEFLQSPEALAVFEEYGFTPNI